MKLEQTVEGRGRARLPVPIGGRFGKLVVLDGAEPTSDGRSRWLCRCDCGTERAFRATFVKVGKVNSCGCGVREASLKHGCGSNGKEHPLYKMWIMMRQRCSNPNDASYENYGARGIEVCARWDDFAAFLEDMGEKPSPDHSIDRIDNDGNYEPDNCRWATWSEQNRNRRPFGRRR